MNYIVYADVMFFWNFIINITVLTIASRLLHIRIRYKRLMFFSFMNAMLTCAIYIMLIDSILLPLLYSSAYLFMTLMYFKTNSVSELLQKSFAVIISMPVIYGLINIFKGGVSASLNHILIMLVAGMLFLCSGIRIIRHKMSCIYKKVILTHAGKSIQAIGYYDTGNTLYDPFTHKPVMIIDSRLVTKITGTFVEDIIKNYLSCGLMDYESFEKKTGILLHPVPFQTINSGVELMPVFTIDSMELYDEKKCFKNTAIGISRKSLENGFQILLNENIN